MPSFQRSTVTFILLGWHCLLAASGHGLHHLVGGGGHGTGNGATHCECRHECPATAVDDSASHAGREAQVAAEPTRHKHDPHRCVICQYLAQHKGLPPATATLLTAAPHAEPIPGSSSTPHCSCACPYASRAPPGASILG